MATTTNYGWTTPDDTALVKDGASAIRTLGSSVDTTTKNLNPETTLGDLSFRSSTSNVNTRIPIGSSGQHLTVVAGVPAWATASDQTPLTTKGDLLGFSTLDARIPIGTNGHILTADSTESLGLKWAAPASGGMTLINSGGTALSGPSVNINTIPGTYNMLILKIENYRGASDGTTVRIRFNGDDAANRYKTVDMGTTSANYAYSATSGDLGANQDSVATSTAFSYTTIPNYASATQWKMAQVFAIGNWYLDAAEVVIANNTIAYNQTTAITSIDLFPNSGNFSTGTAYLYGVK